jgi:hypothetical protein
VLARSGRSGGLGHAMRDFCVAGNASALVKQIDRGRQPQHAVASVLAKGGWAAAAAAAAEVDRSYLVLAVNTLQASTQAPPLPPLHHSNHHPPPPPSSRACSSTASQPTACPSASTSCPQTSFSCPMARSAQCPPALRSTPWMTCCCRWWAQRRCCPRMPPMFSDQIHPMQPWLHSRRPLPNVMPLCRRQRRKRSHSTARERHRPCSAFLHSRLA